MGRRSPTLDDLILLNREIAALVKAGIPLELGLRGLSTSVGSRLGKLSERILQQLAAGRTLPDALAAEGPAISPVYTAVVEAGLASGRLPEALESLAVSGQTLQETGRRVFLAVLNPLVCLVIGYVLFCGFLLFIVPEIVQSSDMLGMPDGWPIRFLRILHQHHLYATMLVPAVLFALLIVTVLLRDNVMRGLWRWIRSFGWVPGVSTIRRNLNWAQFTEILALQLEQIGSLPRALVLAAESTDDPRWQRDARQVGDRLAAGSTLAESLQPARSLPTVIRWMLAAGERQGTLALTLRQLSEMYRRRALQQAAALKIWLPVIMTICVTGSIGLVYGLAFFVPLRALLLGLMQE